MRASGTRISSGKCFSKRFISRCAAAGSKPNTPLARIPLFFPFTRLRCGDRRWIIERESLWKPTLISRMSGRIVTFIADKKREEEYAILQREPARSPSVTLHSTDPWTSCHPRRRRRRRRHSAAQCLLFLGAFSTITILPLRTAPRCRNGVRALNRE